MRDTMSTRSPAFLLETHMKTGRPPKPHIPSVCEQCATRFEVYPSQAPATYCSAECYHAARPQKVDVRCACGKLFRTSACEVRRGNGKCCSKTCYGTYTARPLADRFWDKVQKSDGCWIFTGANAKGYGVIGRCDGTHEYVYAHRLSWELHHGPIPDGLCVLHHCDTPRCVNPEHLWLGTIADNNRDMSQKGRNWRSRNSGVRSDPCVSPSSVAPLAAAWLATTSQPGPAHRSLAARSPPSDPESPTAPRPAAPRQ